MPTLEEKWKVGKSCPLLQKMSTHLSSLPDVHLFSNDITSIILLERMYPSVIAPEICEGMILMAKERAIVLGLTLISKEVGQGPDYAGVAASLEGAQKNSKSDEPVLHQGT